MTKIKGKWITQELTELRILEKLLKKGPLNMPAIEDRKGKDRLSHASVRIGISKLLEEKKIKVVDVDKSIPKRPVKTFEITPVGTYQYLEWIFPEEGQKPKYSDDIWESIKESGRKFVRQNITPYYFPVIDKYWKKLEQIGEAPFWWFGVAFGSTEFTVTPSGRNVVKDPNVPLGHIFSFSVPLGNPDNDYDRSYALKVSKVVLVFPDITVKGSEEENSTDGIESYSYLQKFISNTITFLFFYYMLHNLIGSISIFRLGNNQKIITKNIDILNTIVAIIKNDKNLQSIFRGHLAIIDSQIKTDKIISYLFKVTS